MQKRLITTGGTIDMLCDPISGDTSFNGDTHVPEMLRRGKVNLHEWTIQELMQIDSRDMTDAHREVIVAACIESPELRILITHETETMPETARLIKRTLLNRRLGHRTIVLTGARIPYDAPDSDTLFNLGAAIDRLNSGPTGVWVSMNGDAFEADHVVNDKELGIFRRRTEADGYGSDI